jgi:hypothetical protein
MFHCRKFPVRIYCGTILSSAASRKLRINFPLTC